MTCAYMLLKCLTNLEVVQCPIEEITTSYDSSMIEDISLNIEINKKELAFREANMFLRGAAQVLARKCSATILL